MNSPVKIQNSGYQTTLCLHRRRCIAAYIHERTKSGKPTTCRQVADAHDLDVNTTNSLLRLCMTDPTQTTYGAVIVVPVGKGTDPNGVTAMRYAAILHHEKTTNQ